MSIELRKDSTTIVTLIFSAVVLIFSVLFTYFSNQRNDELKMLLIDKTKEMNEQKEIFEKSVKTFHELSDIIGWFNSEDIEKSSSFEKIIKDLNDWNKKLKEQYKYDQYAMWELVPDAITGQNIAEAGITAVVILDKLEEMAKTQKENIKEHQGDFDQHVKAARTYLGEDGKFREMEKEKQRDFDIQMKRQADRKNDIMATIKKGEETLKELQRQIESRRGIIDSIKKEKEALYAELRTQKAELEKRLDFMTAEPVTPREGIDIDGRITEVFQATSYAYIDIGRKDCLFPGTSFTVYRLLKDGVPRRIGEIVVMDVLDNDTAKAAIVSTISPEILINAGDYVANQKFDKNSPKVFVLVGRLKMKYSNETAIQKLTDLGWKVDLNISIYTTYAVIGEGFQDAPEFKAAQKLGISILGERELLQLID
ncbi:MAG: hypothetical protein HZA48_00435 [Planctomycetes bacterium]|nr:hypothetical protein [Planctomycetota bacterium]